MIAENLHHNITIKWLQKRRVWSAAAQTGYPAETRRQRQGWQAASEGRHAHLVTGRRSPLADDSHPLTVARRGAKIQNGNVVRGSPWRRGCHRRQELRSKRTIDDVHLKDGAHFRQREVLCVRARFLWKGGNWTESTYHGAKLHARKEGRFVREGHSKDYSDDGAVRGGYWRCALRYVLFLCFLVRSILETMNAFFQIRVLG